jgi:hypothetical protein
MRTPPLVARDGFDLFQVDVDLKPARVVESGLGLPGSEGPALRKRLAGQEKVGERTLDGEANSRKACARVAVGDQAAGKVGRRGDHLTRWQCLHRYGRKHEQPAGFERRLGIVRTRSLRRALLTEGRREVWHFAANGIH